MIKFGEQTYVNVQHEEYFGPDVIIGNFSSVAEGVIFCGSMNHECIEHPEAVSTFPFRTQLHLDYFNNSFTRGPIVIGSDTWIGRDVMILDGITIGNGCIIGAKAVVTKDVPDYAVVAGNPGEIKKYRFNRETRERLLSIKWWDWPVETIKERIVDFHNIKEFINKYYKS